MLSLNARILIIDDSNAARDLVRAALIQLNLKVLEEAENGRIAWTKIQQSVSDGRIYDLIIADVNMPEMDGLKLLNLVRSDEKTANIPMIIVTTEGSKMTVIKAVMEGVSGYIVKPFAIDDIKKKVIEVMSRARLDHNNKMN